MQWSYVRAVKSSTSGTPEIEKVDSRAHATEFIYVDAEHFQGVAEEMWSELDWRIEAARTARYVIKGQAKAD